MQHWRLAVTVHFSCVYLWLFSCLFFFFCFFVSFNYFPFINIVNCLIVCCCNSLLTHFVFSGKCPNFLIAFRLPNCTDGSQAVERRAVKIKKKQENFNSSYSFPEPLGPPDKNIWCLLLHIQKHTHTHCFFFFFFLSYSSFFYVLHISLITVKFSPVRLSWIHLQLDYLNRCNDLLYSPHPANRPFVCKLLLSLFYYFRLFWGKEFRQWDHLFSLSFSLFLSLFSLLYIYVYIYINSYIHIYTSNS